MRVTDLGSRPAPASLRNLISRMVWGQGPANAGSSTTVERRQVPYWQERGWKLDGNAYSGNYLTPHAVFQGWISQERSGHFSFFLHNPSPQIRNHSHWTCFQHRSDGWYLIHMGRKPKDVSSGIMTIEQLIREAYSQ